MSGSLSRFPVTSEDIAASITASLTNVKRGSLDLGPPPKRPPKGTATAPGSARGTPPPLGRPPLASSGLLTPNSLSPSRTSSRRPSGAGLDSDSRRESVTRMATDAVRKGVRNVTDSTKKAGTKVKDKTAGMGAHVKVATVGASKWVANHTSKTAKAAMDQARSGLSIGEKFTLFAFEKISVLSRKGFTHVFMFAIMVAYTALGAMLFIACEAPHEEAFKEKVNVGRQSLIKNLWSQKNSDYTTFEKVALDNLGTFEEEIAQSIAQGVSSDPEDRLWTFWKAMFFCSTITTTIGYGHMTPKTSAGRALTIVYAIIGIPIFLILIADFGKLFTRILKALFIFIRKMYRSGTCVKARKHPTIQRASGRYELFKKWICCRWKKTDDDAEGGRKDELKKIEEEDEEKIRAEVEEKYFADGNFSLPVSLALFILILYMIFGCFIYINWESWEFFEAFYFIFVSMTTIGFGDLVPEHPGFMMATTVYLIFGLALTAMCINIIQEKLTITFREASVKLKDSFHNIMAAAAETEEVEVELEEGEGGIQLDDEDIPKVLVAIYDHDKESSHPTSVENKQISKLLNDVIK